MKYILKLWSYLTYGGIMLNAIMDYNEDRDEQKLAITLAENLYPALNKALKGKAKKKVSQQRINTAAAAIASVIEDAL